ncbi:uncharacterized protein LOC127494387 isoform X2 [Ctenopharyngodon idella]|uniref:uncharacterized protein LOC127494387 isoform X2 n=1 Tax=Ctenopharyngodon idella TaxID=7959 RepID=UPI00222E18DD|nr:uncharacterized protein LOC127494387 isoform X2 [Ctenopharyngodon idella]
MMLIFGLMLLLLQTAACVEFNCRFNQSDPCYAALGHKLNLLMVDTSEYVLKIQKRINNNQDDPVCRVKNDKIKENQCDLFNDRTEVTVINGTLIINRVIRADSGIYTLRLEGSDGTVTSADLQVNVEAPIGSVEVSISCSSNGMKSVSCSSDGDQLIYSWTLNGESLMDGNTTIQLNEETDGNIICSVKNHVSDGQKSIRVKHCPGVEFNCRFNQADPCYAALGHKLNLLMVDTSEYVLKIQKRINNNQDDPVCRVRSDKIKECDFFNNRTEVTVINGTLIINRVIRADSGIYTLILEGSDGTETSADLQVNVEAPIGSVNVSISCSSNGMKSVSCSSDGDQLIYSWTLNGESLMDGNTTIQLNEETDGNIICSVKNHVSHEQKSIRVKHCPGVEFNCRFNQSDPCYAALGHKLNLLMVDTSKYVLKIQKRINNNQDDPVCRVKNDKIRECDLFNNRTEVTVINGTLIINRVIRADSGIYTLRLDHSDGTETSADLQVNVEAPIGSVNVSISCSSNGMKSVSCSSDGDQLIYNWTLNGESLMDGNTTIQLNEETDGNIICSVKNHVSHEQKSIRVKHCPGVEFNCRFNQSDPCYAALGHKLNLLMVDTSEYDLKIQKRINNNQDDPVCRVKNEKKKENQCDLFNNRTEMTVINGTLIINRVIRADSGIYTLRLEHSDGTETSADLQVNVEAPIGSVEVSISCSSNGMKSVSCSSDGDQLIYNWTLNGESLMDGNTTIQLNEETDGNIICSVKNHVSHGQKNIRVKHCPGVEFNCRFNQADPCYAVLGHKLSLLMVDTSEYVLKIQKRINNNQDDPVCRVKNDKIKENQCDLFNDRTEVTVINGTLIINRVIRADSGIYTLILEGSDGTETSADLQVNVEGVEFNCRFNQSDPCYAALGHKLNLLMVNTSEYRLMIQKRINNNQDDPVCRVKNDKIKECDLFNDRTEVTVINGTLIINRVIRADSGIYTLILEGSDGTVTSADLQVNVEVPIGSVEVSISCSSNGMKSVSCSSDGDQLIYSWTLNGESLMDGNTTIQLNEETDGNIICSVKNHVSHRQKSIRVKHCPGVERFCRFNQADPCYAALGHKLNLLMVNTSEYVLKIQKRINNNQDDPVCRVKNDKIKENQCDLFNDRTEVINRTLIINRVIRADSGIYTLRLEGSDGTETSADLQVNVEGVEFNCRFNQADPCYAALGHKLNLLMVDTSEYDLKIQKRINNNQDDPVCRVKNDKIRECDLFNNRTEVTVINGTLIINRVIRADSGIYTLRLEHSDGTETSADLQVNVEAPIGSVEVSISCSSNGMKSVSCSSDGDQLIYNWTLNGESLMDGNTTIQLNEETDGNIICSVENHVSHGQKNIRVKHCPGVERFCRFNQADPCYAALGHKLNLLMVDTSKYDLKIQKRINNNQDDPVCRVKNDKIKENQCDLFNDRTEVTVINGTLIINRVIRADSGNYTLRLISSDGTETSADLQVNVEAPIGSVNVSISCSSNGMKSVSCSSDGDQLIYSWTLNGESLMDGKTTIQLNEETDGNIICSVKNHVSDGQKSIRVKHCPGVEFNCRFNQSDPCYAALGHKLNLLMVDTSKYRLKIQKRINNNQDDPVCKVVNDKIRETECDLFNDRTEVTVINGTLIINRVIRADSGIYTLRLEGSDGTETSADLQVNVEAPIGSVEVSISCSSNGMKSVSCSSDGDQLIYSWTLNGESLMDGNTTIQLNEETDGNIICSVKNHVSHRQKNIRVKHCPGVERFCRFNQSDPCYAALGHKLNLLMVDTSKYVLKIQKRINNNQDDPVCRVRSDKIRETECDLFNNRTEVTVINGTLIINRVIRADSGIYTLRLEHSDGTVTSAYLQVNVEAPIGSVEVSISCSSNGMKSVSCSSDGDQLIYNWTLNGESLMDGNTTIQLKEETDGNIICSVKNHVSDRQKSIRVKHCPGPTTTAAAVTSSLTPAQTSSTQAPDHGTSLSSADTSLTPTPTQSSEPFPSWKFIKISLIVLGCVSLILILLFITACHFYKRKQLQSTPVSAGDTELVYAQISHDKHKKSEKNKSESLPAADVEYAAVRPQTKQKERKEEEVQYGEVTFTPNCSNTLQEPKEECVYSQVQRR